MSGNGGFATIVFFACVAVFLGLQLRRILGRRNDDERPPAENNNVRAFPGSSAHAPYARAEVDTVGATLARIRSFDSAFDAAAFLDGAKIAFRMVVEAFAKGDEAALRPLLDDVVFGQFSDALAARAQARETNLSELLELVSADIEDAVLDGPVAQLTVRFASRQNILVKNAAGAVVEGGPNHPVDLVDHWMFARDLRSPSPNWLLVATRSGEE